MNLPITQIKLDPRLRIDFSKVSEIAESMQRLGQIAPIVVEARSDGYYLLDGGQRLKAAESLGWVEINTVELKNLDPLKRLEIEIEANEKRFNYTWQERCLAYKRVHYLKGFANLTWSIKKLQELIGKSYGHVNECLAIADALEQTIEQKTDWEKGLWACSGVVEALQYLAIRHEKEVFSEIERRKKAQTVSVNLGKELPTLITETDNIPEHIIEMVGLPHEIEICNRQPEPGECSCALIFDNISQPLPDNFDLLPNYGGVLIWTSTLQNWLEYKSKLQNSDLNPLAFPLIWNTIKGKKFDDCPFYLNYKLGLFLSKAAFRCTEPYPAVCTCPQPDDGSIPLQIVSHSLDAISREGDKVWLPQGGPIVKVAQCGRIPVWPTKDEETIQELKDFYIELKGKCNFI